MKKLLSLILLALVSNIANAVPVAYNVTGYAWISGDHSYIVNGSLVMDDANSFSSWNQLNYNMLSLDLAISNGSTTYNLNSTNGFMTYYRPGISDTEYFADGWFIHTALGAIYDMNQLPGLMTVGSEALPSSLGFSLSSDINSPFYFDPNSHMQILEFSAVVVPVPAALVCLLSGLAGLGIFGRVNKSA
jgi:hypothetical protein